MKAMCFEDLDCWKLGRDLSREIYALTKSPPFPRDFALIDQIRRAAVSVMTNIAGKQKNLALITDKLTNVLRQVMSTPQILQDPEMVKIFNQIMESSGLQPINFRPAPVQTQPAQSGSTQPLQQMAQTNQ